MSISFSQFGFCERRGWLWSHRDQWTTFLTSLNLRQWDKFLKHNLQIIHAFHRSSGEYESRAALELEESNRHVSWLLSRIFFIREMAKREMSSFVTLEGILDARHGYNSVKSLRWSGSLEPPWNNHVDKRTSHTTGGWEGKWTLLQYSDTHLRL